MKRSDMLLNLLAQLVYSPDETTANSIKNHIGWPERMLMTDKAKGVQLLRDGLADDTEVTPPWEKN